MVFETIQYSLSRCGRCGYIGDVNKFQTVDEPTCPACGITASGEKTRTPMWTTR